MRRAIADLVERKDPLWKGITPEMERVDRVFADLLRIDGRDSVRPAYLILLRPPVGRLAGLREVVVDALDGTIIASIEKVDLALSARDQVRLPIDPARASEVTDFETHWSGDMECPPRRTDGPAGATPLERDIDESKSAMCETDRYFAARGGEFVSPNYVDWIDRFRNGLKVHLCAEIAGNVSVGINWGARGIGLACGVGRAEIIGHEFGHNLFGGSGNRCVQG